MKRLLSVAWLTALVLACGGLAAHASALRETPLVQAIRKAQTGVVNIHSEKTADDDGLFAGTRGRKVNGMGTGIVVDERGYIVTNYHVVQGVDSLRVTQIDGSAYNARVISYDRDQDLAIIKIDATRPLDVMVMGTSSDLMLGETVVAIGNAFGYEHTITSGILSSLSRDVEVNETQSYEKLLQTDASINPGNSGGPLLNLDGEVIAINVAIRAGAQRIGFAIPIDDARRTIARLLAVDALDGTRHGIDATNTRSSDTRELVVRSAASGSPADAAGIQPGDVIVKAGRVAVTDRADLERALLGHSAGDEVSLVVRRANENIALSLKLAESSGAHDQAVTVVDGPRAGRLTAGIGTRAWQILGLQLAQNSLSARLPTGTPYRGGLPVAAVRPGSPADRNGIRPGDILVGLHLWETINNDNVSYVINHPEFPSFSPLKFYIIRGSETLYGYMKVAVR